MLDQLLPPIRRTAAAQASNKALQETIDTSIKANTAALIRFESRALERERRRRLLNHGMDLRQFDVDARGHHP